MMDFGLYFVVLGIFIVMFFIPYIATRPGTSEDESNAWYTIMLWAVVFWIIGMLFLLLWD